MKIAPIQSLKHFHLNWSFHLHFRQEFRSLIWVDFSHAHLMGLFQKGFQLISRLIHCHRDWSRYPRHLDQKICRLSEAHSFQFAQAC
jgi:hypothetical protein